LANWSWTESIDQRAFGLASTRMGARVPTALRRARRFRTQSPSSRWSRWIRLMPRARPPAAAGRTAGGSRTAVARSQGRAAGQAARCLAAGGTDSGPSRGPLPRSGRPDAPTSITVCRCATASRLAAGATIFDRSSRNAATSSICSVVTLSRGPTIAANDFDFPLFGTRLGLRGFANSNLRSATSLKLANGRVLPAGSTK
jgi:hypothetical protein